MVVIKRGRERGRRQREMEEKGERWTKEGRRRREGSG